MVKLYPVGKRTFIRYTVISGISSQYLRQCQNISGVFGTAAACNKFHTCWSFKYNMIQEQLIIMSVIGYTLQSLYEVKIALLGIGEGCR